MVEGAELRYSFTSDANQPVTALVSTQKGFIAGTGAGSVLVFEKDDNHGFRRVKSVAVEFTARIVAMAVSAGEDLLAVSTDNNQLLTMPINAVELLKARPIAMGTVLALYLCTTLGRLCTRMFLLFYFPAKILIL